MKKVTITEAQNTLLELIDTAEQGEDIHLTQYRIPIAVLISEERYQQLVGDGKQLFNAIMQWRDQYQHAELSDEEIGSWRNQSSVQTTKTQNIVELLAMDDDIEFDPPKLPLNQVIKIDL